MTALYNAAKTGRPSVKLLLERGADASAMKIGVSFLRLIEFVKRDKAARVLSKNYEKE